MKKKLLENCESGSEVVQWRKEGEDKNLLQLALRRRGRDWDEEGGGRGRKWGLGWVKDLEWVGKWGSGRVSRKEERGWNGKSQWEGLNGKRNGKRIWMGKMKEVWMRVKKLQAFLCMTPV